MKISYGKKYRIQRKNFEPGYSLGHFFILFWLLCSCHTNERSMVNAKTESYGAIIRTDTTRKEINLVFTAHDFNDGFDTVIRVLRRHGIHASFFLTGDFYREPANREIIKTLISDGHYLGAHSGKHLLFCSWEKRDSLLVSKEEFRNDLADNFKAMEAFGITKNEARFFLPAYEWYNRRIFEWLKEEGLVLVNFSPGTSSNQDWTYPELGKPYLSSDTILSRIKRYERSKGMNGFILLIHPGTDPRRKDKLYNRLDALIGYLAESGYGFTRIDGHR